VVWALGAHNLPVDSWGGSHDDGEWIRPGEARRPGSRREDRPSDPYDDGSFVRAVPREESPPARRPPDSPADPYGPRGRDEYFDDHFEDSTARGGTVRDLPRHDAPRHDTYDGYGYGDDYQYEQEDAAYAHEIPYARDARRGGGGASPFATGWLPLWPTIAIALAAVILAFIIGHVTAGGGGSTTSTTATTAASTTTTSAVPLTATVQRGDTLSAIASRFGVSPTALAQYNNITDPSHIFVGQVLNIPPKQP
jgi:LysM repeat protein